MVLNMKIDLLLSSIISKDFRKPIVCLFQKQNFQFQFGKAKHQTKLIKNLSHFEHPIALKEEEKT